MVEGVLSLPPGHFLKIHANHARRVPEPKLYWNFTKEFYQDEEAKTGTAYQEDFASAATTVRSLLEDAVRSHLVADVPVGVFLSSASIPQPLPRSPATCRKAFTLLPSHFPMPKEPSGDRAKHC